MKKKLYEKPTMQIVKLQHQAQLLADSPGGEEQTNSAGINAMGDPEDL